MDKEHVPNGLIARSSGLRDERSEGTGEKEVLGLRCHVNDLGLHPHGDSEARESF